MKYTCESQEKALKYLIENAPHDMEKFKSLYNIEVEGESRAKVRLHDILFSNIWTAEEKVQLIKLYGYKDKRNPENIVFTSCTDKNYGRYIGYVDIDGLSLIDECIKEKNFSGVQALLSLGYHISAETIKCIIEYIDNPSERYQFCELIINYYKDKESIEILIEKPGKACYLKEIPSLCDRYPEHIIDFYGQKRLWTVSSMEYICRTNDLELVKLFLPTIKHINPLFMFAVRSKNIEMVKLFIEAGADVNFQDLEFENDNRGILFKTPIKIAIDNNDLKMIKFLYQNGADLDFVDKSERMQYFIECLGKDEVEKEIHQYKDCGDRYDYITWAKTPLEYAINLGAASIIDEEIRDNSSRKNDSFEKQFRDRMDIVKYLYENGATFGEGQINYTDLICFAIKSDDFDSTKYFFEEALKKGSKLDFVKIISFIHHPGIIEMSYYSLISYKSFEDGANPWFRLCERYSKQMDSENYDRNIKLMLERLFDKCIFGEYQFNIYRAIITDFSKALPKDTLKEIPAVFSVSLKNVEEILNLGYDINSIKNGINILMDYIINKQHVDIEIINKLISLGANINYQSPQSGNSALSCVMAKLPEYDFGKFIHNFNRETGQLYYPPEEYEKEIKSLVKAIIELSNQKIIMSESVKENVYWRIKPGYPQIIYNEILETLSKKGFKVDDDYVTKSITFLDEEYSKEYVTNPWKYLWNLYSNFSNKSIETNHPFPKIETAKDFKYSTEQSNNLFALISEHLKRNFATSVEDIQEPDKIEGYYYDSINYKFEDRTALQAAQDKLLCEISRYIGNLDYCQIMALIDSCSLIDIKSIIRNELLPIAMNVGDKKLCRKLVQKGATIICYDENGHDVTSKKYSAEQINIFLSLNEEYNPNKEYEDLLAEISCGDKVLSKK